ncbi:MAG: hypothetical protein J5711_02955 [Bacteroidales bacterium]|nr:hypothetical protein [Bacteroidales bacterium]
MSHRDYIERFFAARTKGDEALCRELVGEAYINIFSHFDSLRQGSTLLHRKNFVMWRCRDTWSRHKRNAQSTQFLPFEDHMDAISPDDEANEFLRESIEKLASLLSKRERMYFQLMADGYSDDDIATTLDVKRDSVISTRHRILKRLRKLAGHGHIRLKNATVIVNRLNNDEI